MMTMSAAAAAADFDLQGHRGARGLAPENTLSGFARALGIGVGTLELDTGVSADGVVVVIHNPRLEPDIARDAMGRWLDESSPPIHTLEVEKIKTYDVGRLNPARRYASRFPDQVPVDGARVPTLAETFELVKRSGNHEVRFNIETKLNPLKPQNAPSPETFVEAILKVVREYGFENRVSIQSFDWQTLKAVQHLAPKVRTSYLTAAQSWANNLRPGEPGPSPWLGGYDIDAFDGSAPAAVKAAGGDIWSSYHREVTADNIERAHELGLLVKVWTVNERDRMETLIDMGVDGIITDYPDILREVMVDRGMPVPPATPVAP